jgi:hypothetical protein
MMETCSVIVTVKIPFYKRWILYYLVAANVIISHLQELIIGSFIKAAAAGVK